MASASCLQIPVLRPCLGLLKDWPLPISQSHPSQPKSVWSWCLWQQRNPKPLEKETDLVSNLCLLGYVHFTMLLLILGWGGRAPLLLFLMRSLLECILPTQLPASCPASLGNLIISRRNLTFRHLSYNFYHKLNCIMYSRTQTQLFLPDCNFSQEYNDDKFIFLSIHIPS